MGKTKRKAGALVWRRVGDKEQISTLELQILANREIPGLLSVECVKALFGRRLTARCGQLIPLEHWLRSRVPFRAFIGVAQQAVRTVQECQSYGLNTGNLEADVSRMYLEPGTLTLKLLYWPVERIGEYPDEGRLFFLLGRAYHPRPGEEKYRLQYLELFHTRAVFDIFRFEQELQRLGDRERQDKGIREGAPASTQVYCLIRRTTGERCIIRHFPFAVGRERNRCDYVLSRNPRISARHLLLRRGEGGVCLVDNGSTNRTRLNGKEIPQNVNVPISPGCVIEIGGEQLLFQQVKVVQRERE